jgi:quercetin dioxygenase-like cupin family protein
VTTPSHVPTGNYPAHAPVHLLDLEAEADRLLAKLPGHRRQSETLAREAGVSVVMMAMEAGDIVSEHHAKSPVSIQLLRGHARLSVGSQESELRPGQLAFIQPELPHGLHAEEQSVVVITISAP